MSKELNENFWTQRYQDGSTGWDLGYVSTPIKEYADQLSDKSIRILIPGAGNSYEGEYLWKQGFKNVYIADISEEPLHNFSERVPDFPKEQLLHEDFFSLDDQFDLILEQTFYCALDPKLRDAYVEKMHGLLKPGGKLVGVLFTFPLESGPPFGGSMDEYRERFSRYFDLKKLEECYNSIPPRAGNEAFLIAQKK
jgi:SAM-dependent methyltransferase